LNVGTNIALMATESRWITLVRHGPVDVHWQSRIAGGAFAGFMNAFQLSGIVATSEPTADARHQARKARILVCSDLRRSFESASMIDPTRTCLRESLFREAALPTEFQTSLSFRASSWLVLARILWYVRRWPGIESPSDACERARRATSYLEHLVERNDSVLLVGHGYFNTLVARELRRRGWRGPNLPNVGHWGTTTYRPAV
jgi:broad specificity phosphatase PhoE